MFSPEYFQSGILSLPCINTTAEEIPPYGCMAMWPQSGSGPPVTKKGASAATEFKPGAMQVYVRKPVAADITIGSPAIFCFNTDIPIPSSANSGRGRCTLGIPTFAQLEFNKARVRGAIVGPKAGSWLLHAGVAPMFAVRTWWISGSVDIALVDRLTSGVLVHAKTPAGGIPAAVDGQMGSATCDIWASDSSGLRTDTGVDETVYNSTSGDVAGSTTLCLQRDTSGLLVVTVENCGA